MTQRKGQKIINWMHKYVEIDILAGGETSWFCPKLFYMEDEEFDKMFSKVVEEGKECHNYQECGLCVGCGNCCKCRTAKK